MLNSDTHYAKIEWRDGIPFSLQFNDYYFSKQSGIAESNYVFIEHNQLVNRVEQLKPNQHLTIIETGFGGALNLLSTVIAWNNCAKADNAQLNYISIERYPLSPNDLQQLLQLFPELYTQATELLKQYYLLTQGYHRFYLGNNIYLTLIIEDVVTALIQLNTYADIWYFDGFSPSKNNEMWNTHVINLAAKLSYAKTTFSTYSANSELQRTLSNNGFIVKKAKGFGTKREMLYGTFSQPQTNQIKQNKLYLTKPMTHDIKKIAIIGGGISGATTAYSLALRGYDVTIFERNPMLAMEASGNNQGVVYGNFSIHDKLMFELNSNAYRLSNQRINKFDPNNHYHEQCGVIQLAHNTQQLKRNQELIDTIIDNDFVQHVNQSQIEEICGASVFAKSGIFFPNGMWLNPSCYIHELVKQSNILIYTNQNITKITQINNKWILYNHEHAISENFDAVVLCNSFMLNQFEQTKSLPIRKIRGQVSLQHGISPVKCIVCGDGYVTPNFQHSFSFGATFDFKHENFEVTLAEHQQNLDTLNNMLKLDNKIDITALTGKTNIRVSPNDYFPIIGPISNKEIFEQQFAKLNLDKNYRFKETAQYIPNLFINCGYSSKGLLWANLGGEIIADYITNTQLPISENLRQALHPNRLYARELIKKCRD